MKQQNTLMKFDPATGEDTPYPSHADQWRDWHGHSTAWLFNPWTGERRDARNVGSDVAGHLIIPPGEPIYLAPSLSSDLMDCVDRLGSEADTVDPRVWEHLLVYCPVQIVKNMNDKRLKESGNETESNKSIRRPWYR